LSIVKAGRTLTRELIKGDTSTGIGYIGVGDGTTSITDADTTLSSEDLLYDAGTRSPARAGQYGAGIARIDTTLLSSDFVGIGLAEVGLFTASTSGTMFLRHIHTAEAKSSTEEIEYIIKVTVA